MRSTRLGCLSFQGIMASLIVLLAVGGMTAFRGGVLFSPGSLSALSGKPLGGVTSHSQITACSACHPPFWSDQTLADRCLQCHTDIALQEQNGQGIHGLLKKFNVSTCQQCHPEHKGPNAPTTVVDAANFPHQATGYALNGHQKNGSRPFACADCHPTGLTSFDVAICETCHAQLDRNFSLAHLAAFGSACLNCHDGVDAYGPSFDHNKLVFALQGKHARLACQNCHSNQTTLVAVKSTQQKCIACHAKDDAHQGQLGTDCGSCHNPSSWANVIVDHAKLGFPLTGKHASVACQACHPNNAFANTPTGCVSCHQKDNIHGTDLGLDCQKCHTPDGWSPAAFDHSLSEFVLVGAHAQTACQNCHVNNQWTGLPTTCYGCHQKVDFHHGQFGQDCSFCHTTTAWLPANFDHSGVNAADCISCHSNNEPPNHFPGQCSLCHTTSAWLPANFNHAAVGAVDCISCHANKAPANHYSGQCSLCHTTTAWLPANFNHAAMGAVDCISCHANKAPVNHFSGQCSLCHNTSAWLPANFNHQAAGATDCQSCHARPANHFPEQCSQCHDTTSWANATFSHPFPINHGGAGGVCANCHPNGTSSYTCYTCHNQAEMVQKHASNNILNIAGRCVSCHPTGGSNN